MPSSSIHQGRSTPIVCTTIPTDPYLLQQATVLVHPHVDYDRKHQYEWHQLYMIISWFDSTRPAYNLWGIIMGGATVLKVGSGGARPGHARSNDLAERIPPWLPTWLPPGCHFFKEGVQTRHDAVCVNLPTAKMWNKSQVSINVIFFHHCLGKKIVIRLLTDVIWHCMFAFAFKSHGTAFWCGFLFLIISLFFFLLAFHNHVRRRRGDRDR